MHKRTHNCLQMYKQEHTVIIVPLWTNSHSTKNETSRYISLTNIWPVFVLSNSMYEINLIPDISSKPKKRARLYSQS